MSSPYQLLLGEEVDRIRPLVQPGTSLATMQDIARARVAKKMEARANILKLLFNARRSTTLVPCPWGSTPLGLIQQQN